MSGTSLPPPSLPSDRQLLDAARRGDEQAWSELAQRHGDAVDRTLGRGRSARRQADEVLDDVRRRILAADPPPEGTPAVRVLRAAILAEHTRGFFGPQWPGVIDPGSAGPPGDPSDDELLALAFATLPEPWQTVLWHTDVEDEDPGEVAPFVGRAPGDVAGLLATARRGLVDAFFREYERLGPFDSEGAAVVPLLARYHHGTLDADGTGLVDTHLRRDHIALAPPSGASVGAPSPALPAPDIGDAPGAAGSTWAGADDFDDVAAILAAPLLPESEDEDIVAGAEPPDSEDEDLVVGAEPPAPSAALAPPVLRRHDAVDSRRLLSLMDALHERLAAAVRPGVGDPSSITASARAVRSVPAFVPVEEDDDTDSRSWWLVAGAVGALVILGVLGALFFRGDDGESSPPNTSAPGDPAVVGDGPSDEPATDPNADDAGDSPPTTSLALRPDAAGPLNTIEVTLTDLAPDDDGPEGFAAPRAAASAADVELRVSAPAPVFAGGTGTIDLELEHTGPLDAAVGLTFAPPPGVRLIAAPGDPCTELDGVPTCLLTVPADDVLQIPVVFGLERSVVGRLELDGDVAEPLVVPISVTADLVHSSVGRGGILVAGNTVTRCATVAAAAEEIDCDDVSNGVGDVVNRWDVPIEFVGEIGQFGLFNSSSAVLELPDGAEVLEAHLYWSGDLDERGETIPDDGRNTTIALGLPGGRVQTIEAGRVVLGDVDASQYLGSNDVTELVRSGGPGSYTVGNVQTVDVQGSYGAWALVVVYDHPDEPRRHRLLTRPFEWVAPPDDAGVVYEYGVDLPIPSGSELGELDVFALEGELGFEPEFFEAGAQVLGGSNPFDSSIRGDRTPDEINSLGVDIDTYDLDIDASDGFLPIRVTSEQDGIRIAVLGLTVDLPT